MKINVIFVLSAILSASPNVYSAPIQLSNNARLEVVDSFSTKDLWNVTIPYATKEFGVIVDSRLFDSESQPRNGKWYGCALVMIGTEDMGIQPVAVRIWTTKPCDLKIRPRTTSVMMAEFSMQIDVKEAFSVQVSKDLQVFVGGKTVGQIKDP